MAINYALALALGSSALTGCVVHADPRVVVYDNHRPPVYRIEHYPRPIIHPSHRYYEPLRFEHHPHHDRNNHGHGDHHRDNHGHGHHHGRG